MTQRIVKQTYSGCQLTLRLMVPATSLLLGTEGGGWGVRVEGCRGVGGEGGGVVEGDQ